MPRASPLRPVALAAAWACLVATSAAADLAPWDQGRATAIAKQLADASDSFEQAVRKEPELGQVGSGSADAGFGVQKSARLLTERSRELAAHLEKGKGHDDTRNEWRALKEVADDVAEQAQRSELDDSTEAAWAKVADLMRQLAPYYEPKALNP